MRVVLDTNVLISAALKGGFSEDIIKMAANNIITLLTSKSILDELYQKLLDKFEWSVKDAKFFVNIIRQVAEIITIK